MYLVGLTGGIATGKSTVARLLVELGCPLIDADVVAREVVEPGKPAWQQIRSKFGEDYIHADGSLDREKLGQTIFSDQNKRRLLNSITHPQIYRAMVYRVLSYLVKGYPYVILDLPLLLESGAMVKYMSKIIVVTCDEDVQLQRLMARNSYSKEEALQRIQTQLPLAEKCKRATHVISNNGTPAETKQQVLTIYRSLQQSRRHWIFRLAFLGIASSSILVVFGILKLCNIL